MELTFLRSYSETAFDIRCFHGSPGAIVDRTLVAPGAALISGMSELYVTLPFSLSSFSF
jgi:hypothetical protein